jgi:TPR repeat protein/serine/threonine protein kinase
MKTCPQCDSGYPDSQTTCPIHGLPLNEIRDLKAGMVIHQSYRIVRKLGQGGMGAVYLAQHTLMNEPQALKFLSSELSHDEAFTSRFLREVRTLRQIRHKNVVDAGNLEPAEDGTLFFSMEFVDGPDLRGLMHDTTGPFPVELAFSITRGIAEGLGAAHAKGMVHRDIKPENILMAREGDSWLPKIVDFGIVATKESSTAYTKTGGTLLTMAYAAPEQWRGTPAVELDGRTDLYALGGVFYEMLTGQTPFHAENYEGWTRQHQTTPPQPPSTRRPDLANWQGLDALTLRLLAKDREDRPKDVAELLALLDAVRYLPPDVHSETVVESLKSRATELLRGRGFRRVPRWLWIPSVFVMAMAILIAGLAFGLPTSMIAKRADDLDKTQHSDFGGILRNFACTRGDGEACWNLGHMYEKGVGIPEDSSRAMALFLKSCDAGFARGCSSLGYMYEFGIGANQDYSRAVALYSESCDRGFADGCSNSGTMYAQGRGVARDFSRARSLFTKACNASSATGCYNLGYSFYLGEGVARDHPLAATLFLKACDGGNANGCYSLGLMCQIGEGVGKDKERAKELFQKSCSMGEKHSCEDLKELDANEPKPAQVGNPKLPAQQSGLGEIEQQATVLRNQGRDSEAAPLFDQACNGGYPKACRELGYMYSNGYGVEIDLHRAVTLFSKACEGGYANGCTALAWR